MGIKSEKVDAPDGVKADDEIFENERIGNPSGTYSMTGRVISWSLDLSSLTIKLNIINRPEFGSKAIDKVNTVAEFRQEEPWYQSFRATISADFNSKQLLLNGFATYLTGSPHPGHRWGKNTYENVVLTNW
jgi:hypothetical protein